MHEYQSEGARPKRSVRYPAYLEDFEVQYPNQPGASLTAQQPHGREEYQRSHSRMAQQQDISHYSSDEGSGRRTPDSIEARSPQTEPWYLIKDQWSERDEYSSHSLPRESRERLHNLERENRQLRQSQQSMKEEIRQLLEMQKGMQELLTRNQPSQVPPLPEQQPLAPSPPIPSPRTIYREPEKPDLRPNSRVHPVPAPRILPTPHSRAHVDATDIEARLSLPPAQNYYPDSFATHFPSSTPLMPVVSSRSQTHGSPTNPREMQTSVTRQEVTYRGPQPTIPDFIHRDPGEFTRLKLALSNLLPEDATELFKYQVLIDHLKLMEARLIADSFLNSPSPYTDTMEALTDRYGRPHQLALNKIAAVMDSPDIQSGDTRSFESFALQVQALVGLLKTLGTEGEVELRCGSHVARLLTKLPPELRAAFRRSVSNEPGALYTLIDLAKWLKFESWCQDHESFGGYKTQRDRFRPKVDSSRDHRFKPRPATILHGADQPTAAQMVRQPAKKFEKSNAFCPYCDNRDHYLSQCSSFQALTKDQITDWIKTNNRCWKCARSHRSAQCTLKKPCHICNGKHLQILHDVNTKTANEGTCLVSATTKSIYLDRPPSCKRVLLKVVRVILHHDGQSLDTYAVLDDGSERTILLSSAAQKLGLTGKAEDLALRTIRHDLTALKGTAVSFRISTPSQQHKRYHIQKAFTAEPLSLAEYSYPVTTLQQKYSHLKGLPLQPIHKACPLLLIGADHPHLITPIEPVRLGPPGGPAAVKTRLGWTLQGPARVLEVTLNTQCLHATFSPSQTELFRNVERLWQADVIPIKSEREVTRSKQDQEAMHHLQTQTTRVLIDGVNRYATPLLRKKDMPRLQVTKDAVLPNLRNTERSLERDPIKAAAYKEEINKLEVAGYAVKLSPGEVSKEGESWFLPHHLVQHNGKNRVVFNCSFQFQGQVLNDYLLPGPALGPSLLGVLLRFREHTVAVSGDIKGMFHQVRLLPNDKHLLRFVWRDLDRNRPPDIFEWQVLPFGTTCSPCCAIYAVQRHVMDHTEPDDEVRSTVERNFYVDNCLRSLPSAQEARHLVDKLCELLATGGFQLRQWASNVPSVIEHLPSEARSDSTELWLSQDRNDPQETTLGLRWHCQSDTFGYKPRPVKPGQCTLRYIYRVLATQYDPLGFILPFTTRAKLLVQRLWDKQREWDDPNLPENLLKSWRNWEEELPNLATITLPRCLVTSDTDQSKVTRQIHIFCDASEQAYGSVAYLRTEDHQGQIQLTFIIAKSRVAPKRRQTIPRLELCAALNGAQLAKLLETELTLEISRVVMWTDSTTVLAWINSESCRFKVFVGTRISEIQELSAGCTWRYVDSHSNPADDLTRGKMLELSVPNKWSQGPSFLLRPESEWPATPLLQVPMDKDEQRKGIFCGIVIEVAAPNIPEPANYASWSELIEATVQIHKRAEQPSAADYQAAEMLIFQKSQIDSFPEEYKMLKAKRPILSNSRLLTLAPEYDESCQVIRVGGRLRRAEGLETSAIHPIVLDPHHTVTKLLIKDYDNKLCHPGPERIFAEIRRSFWVLRGQEAIRRQQHLCKECKKWKAKPVIPKMADLPPARLRLQKPPFYSTGMDCFGPFQIKIGRRCEKRWGIIFKCLTTRCIHLDLLYLHRH